MFDNEAFIIRSSFIRKLRFDSEIEMYLFFCRTPVSLRNMREVAVSFALICDSPNLGVYGFEQN